MKKLFIIIPVIAVAMLQQSCFKSYNDENLIIGVWTWVYAVDGSGNDLMGTYDYNTAEFTKNGEYFFDIDSYSHSGTYEVLADENLIRMDGNDDWEILKISKSELQIIHKIDQGYEWHFEK